MPFAEHTNAVPDIVRAYPDLAVFILFGLSLGASLAVASQSYRSARSSSA
jgi:hypothetical protein